MVLHDILADSASQALRVSGQLIQLLFWMGGGLFLLCINAERYRDWFIHYFGRPSLSEKQ